MEKTWTKYSFASFNLAHIYIDKPKRCLKKKKNSEIWQWIKLSFSVSGSLWCQNWWIVFSSNINRCILVSALKPEIHLIKESLVFQVTSNDIMKKYIQKRVVLIISTT